jgi:hypothetical protein
MSPDRYLFAAFLAKPPNPPFVSIPLHLYLFTPISRSFVLSLVRDCHVLCSSNVEEEMKRFFYHLQTCSLPHVHVHRSLLGFVLSSVGACVYKDKKACDAT